MMQPLGSDQEGQPSRTQRTASAILDAAAGLFFERGVQHTTIDEIAERANVSVGSVYVHYGSKDGLYLALVEHAIERSEYYTQRATDDPSPLQRVFNLGDAFVEFALNEPVVFRIASMQMFDPAAVDDEKLGPVATRIAERIQRTIGRLHDDLVESMERGEIARTDPGMMMTFLWGAWSGVLALSLRDAPQAVPAEQVRRTLRVAGIVLRRGMMVEPSAWVFPASLDGPPQATTTPADSPSA
ncbi:MAG: TetR/AcrR family transcriptional regulator [Patulibacter sp.]